MPAGIAVFSKPPDQGPVNLSGFTDTIVVTILLPSGSWAIFGKVVIVNEDGDAQNANAKLVEQLGNATLDNSDIRIDGSSGSGTSSLSVSLQGTLRVAATNRVHISCATWRGHTKDAQLVALSVDKLEPSGG
jgi:hypothetical protein